MLTTYLRRADPATGDAPDGGLAAASGDLAAVGGGQPAGPIVVGIDGSPAGLAAARWAAAEAARRRLPVELLHAYAVPAATDPQLRLDAETMLAAALDAVRATAPRVPVTGAASDRPADQALIERSGRASLVVVGHQGHGVGSSLQELRGPVVSRVAALAQAPVAVVHAETGGPNQTGPGRVVVGVDGSVVAATSLGYAFETASLRHTTLQVVRVLSTPPGQGGIGSGRGGTGPGHDSAGPPPDRDQAPPDRDQAPPDRDQAERQLCQWVDRWRDRFPHLPVTLTVAPGHPMCALVEASRDAGLLVVGDRGEGAAAGPLGSVSQQLVHLAHCPVTIVHPDRRTPSA